MVLIIHLEPASVGYITHTDAISTTDIHWHLYTNVVLPPAVPAADELMDLGYS